MNIRNSSDAQSRLIPNHQRIISSKQWIIEDKNSKNQVMTKSDGKRTTATTKSDRKSSKELETAKLQMEYNSVKQENDKLKNVIGKLKQEIDIYTNLLNHTNGACPGTKSKGRSGKYQDNAMMKSLLINTPKRRKKSEVSTTAPAAMRAPTPAPAHASGTKHASQATPKAASAPEPTDIKSTATTPALGATFASASVPGSASVSAPGSASVSASPSTPTTSQTSDDMVSPDDLMLMNTLTDVLNHMK